MKSKDWDDSEQVCCSKCGNSDFKIIEKQTWWTKKYPEWKIHIKRILMMCMKCKTKKQVFFPNLGWDPPRKVIGVIN